MRIYLFITILFLMTGYSGLCSNVVIKGNALEYSGETIQLLTFNNLISAEEVILAESQVNDTGFFSLNFTVSHVTYVFMHLGVYELFMYVEPDKSYIIFLPKRMDKKQADKLNPYFRETEVHLSISDADTSELNFLIRMFDQSFYPYYDKFVMNALLKKDFSLLDKAVESLREPFAHVDNAFFKTYVEYKLGLLTHLAHQQKTREISREFFANRKVHYNNPAYMELFNQVFDKYFQYFGRTVYGKKIYDDIGESKSYFSLSKTLELDSILPGDSLRELVVLKNLYDEFYRANFSRGNLLIILDSLIDYTHIENHRVIGKQIRNKVTRLLVGFPPPDFTLLDSDSNLVSLKDFEGQYVYLNFCICMSYSCMKEFHTLDQLIERYGDQITVITVSVDEQYENMVHFTRQSGYSWRFLHYGHQPDILKSYDIRGFPTYYLIGPDGKLILSPAKSPSENFGEQLFNVLKADGVL